MFVMSVQESPSTGAPNVIEKSILYAPVAAQLSRPFTVSGVVLPRPETSWRPSWPWLPSPAHLTSRVESSRQVE